MKKRMPLDYHGGPVRMTVIDRLSGKKTDSLFKKIWQHIEENSTNCRYYAIQEATYEGEEGLQKLLNCLRKRRWWSGFRSHDLYIAAFLYDGIVYRWSEPTEDRDSIAANNKRIALAKRRDSKW